MVSWRLWSKQHRSFLGQSLRGMGGKWYIRWRRGLTESTVLFGCCLCFFLVFSSRVVSAERLPESQGDAEAKVLSKEPSIKQLRKVYAHVWPEMEVGWKLALGSLIGFLGATLGSIGGVGGGGIFVPMFTLLIGFDPKSSIALSKCMIMGAACSTVYFNLRTRHPTLNLPVIDYDLALFFQPMLMLGISIGVTFNVIFPDWVVTVLLIILFLGTSTRAFVKGIETWKKETAMKREAARLLDGSPQGNDGPSLSYRPLLGGQTANIQMKSQEATFMENVQWKDLSQLLFVWVAFLAIQIIKTFSKTCSAEYWILNALQVPIASVVTLYEAFNLYNGRRTILSRGKIDMRWKVHQLIMYCFCGIMSGIVGGLLGLGGGFILGPLFLELGVPPQVASTTSTFAMGFSSSMSVIQYYLLDRFPLPYASYFIILATLAAFTGQHIVRKIIMLLGRASIIIFVLSLIIFMSAISLGGVGMVNMIKKLERGEYMGFEDLCNH